MTPTEELDLAKAPDVTADFELTQKISLRENGALNAKMIPIEDITPSPYNTRKIFDPVRLAELAKSISVNGIVEPLIVRSHPLGAIRPYGAGEYELVAGERRFRAAQLVDLKEVPCVIRELDHIQTLDQQLIENVQREDLHPIEEAHGFEQRRAAGGVTIEQIAKITGKDRSHVSRRLQLLNLIPEAQEVFLRNAMLPKHALMIARLPKEEQPKAFLYLMTGNWGLGEKARPGEVLKLNPEKKAAESPAELARFIEDVVMRPLAKAPWSKKDAALVPSAGACNTCTKRTGANALLFDEAAAKDERCLDGACYENKFQAHLVQLQTKAAAKGEELKLLPKAGQGVTWQEVHGESCSSETKGVISDGWRRGEKIRVCIDKACPLHGRGRINSDIDSWRGKQKAAQEKLKIERQYRSELWRNVSIAVKNPTLEDLRAVALNLWEKSWHDLRKAYMDTLGIEAPKGAGEYNSNSADYEKPVSKLIAAMKTTRELLVWMTAFTLFRDVFVQTHEKQDTKDELHQAAGRYGVDAANIRKEVDAEWAQKRAKKAEAAKNKKAKEKAPAKTKAKVKAKA